MIAIENPDGVETGIAERWVDGVAVDEAGVAFPTDGRARRIIVRLGPETRSARLLNENAGARDTATV